MWIHIYEAVTSIKYRKSSFYLNLINTILLIHSFTPKKYLHTCCSITWRCVPDGWLANPAMGGTVTNLMIYVIMQNTYNYN
jgi:hypothetical protein